MTERGDYIHREEVVEKQEMHNQKSIERLMKTFTNMLMKQWQTSEQREQDMMKADKRKNKPDWIEKKYD